jgi:hypothetical protein
MFGNPCFHAEEKYPICYYLFSFMYQAFRKMILIHSYNNHLYVVSPLDIQVAVDKKPHLSFSEVMAIVSRGDKPSDVRVIEDRVSQDASVLLGTSTLTLPAKPWETTC